MHPARLLLLPGQEQALPGVGEEVLVPLRALADQPHPDPAVPWGGSEIYRLHQPGIRILYEVDERAAAVYVINVATTA